MTPLIATRAYELYEQQGRQDGQSVQNWDKAEQEIRKNQTEAAPQPETKAEPKPEAKDKPQPEAKADATPEAKAEPKPGTEAKPPTDVSPQLVERVHKLYEELGRQDVRAVEDLENAQRESGKDESRK